MEAFQNKRRKSLHMFFSINKLKYSDNLMCFKYFCVFVMVKVGTWIVALGLSHKLIWTLRSFLAADIYSRAPAGGDTREAPFGSLGILG